MTESSISAISPSGARATVTWGTDRCHVVVAGDVDATFDDRGAAVITQTQQLGRPVEVDLSGVTFFSAAGVNWLTSLYKGVEAGVRVVAASDAVQRVLSICDVPMQSTGGARSGDRQSMSVS
jgi:anti-anti-sigma factor